MGLYLLHSHWGTDSHRVGILKQDYRITIEVLGDACLLPTISSAGSTMIWISAKE